MATTEEPKPPFAEPKQSKPGIEEQMRLRPKFDAPEYRPAGKLAGKSALITGGDSGIGRAVAVLFAKEGADVLISCLPAEEQDARRTADEVAKLGRKAHVLMGDLVDPDYCQRLVDRTVEQFGKLDVLVSNAAHQNRQLSVDEVTYAEFDRTFKTNVYAYFLLAKAAAKVMGPGSSIIVTSSEVAWMGPKQLLAYAGTKGAINTMTKVLAKQLVERGVRVNAVAPGPVWTPLNVADQGTDEAKIAEFGQKTPMGRPAQPEELAPSYVFLASNADSSYITGEILAVMGGESVP